MKSNIRISKKGLKLRAIPYVLATAMAITGCGEIKFPAKNPTTEISQEADEATTAATVEGVITATTTEPAKEEKTETAVTTEEAKEEKSEAAPAATTEQAKTETPAEATTAATQEETMPEPRDAEKEAAQTEEVAPTNTFEADRKFEYKDAKEVHYKVENYIIEGQLQQIWTDPEDKQVICYFSTSEEKSESEYRRDFLEKDKDGQYQPTGKELIVHSDDGTTIISQYCNAEKTESELSITINPETPNWVKYTDRIKDGKREYIMATSHNEGTITKDEYIPVFMKYEKYVDPNQMLEHNSVIENMEQEVVIPEDKEQATTADTAKSATEATTEQAPTETPAEATTEQAPTENTVPEEDKTLEELYKEMLKKSDGKDENAEYNIQDEKVQEEKTEEPAVAEEPVEEVTEEPAPAEEPVEEVTEEPAPAEEPVEEVTEEQNNTNETPEREVSEEASSIVSGYINDTIVISYGEDCRGQDEESVNNAESLIMELYKFLSLEETIEGYYADEVDDETLSLAVDMMHCFASDNYNKKNNGVNWESELTEEQIEEIVGLTLEEYVDYAKKLQAAKKQNNIAPAETQTEEKPAAEENKNNQAPVDTKTRVIEAIQEFAKEYETAKQNGDDEAATNILYEWLENLLDWLYNNKPLNNVIRDKADEETIKEVLNTIYKFFYDQDTQERLKDFREAVKDTEYPELLDRAKEEIQEYKVDDTGLGTPTDTTEEEYSNEQNNGIPSTLDKSFEELQDEYLGINYIDKYGNERTLKISLNRRGC